MIFCPRCGKQVEETISFCPNCGVALSLQSQFTQHADLSSSVRPEVGVQNGEPVTRLDRSVKAGVYGFFLALVINFVSPIYLYSIPSFFTSILMIYFFRFKTLKDGLVAAFTTYIFNDALLNSMGLASLYLANGMYILRADIWAVLYPIINAVTALIAAYIGVRLVQEMKFTKSVDR